LADCEHNREQAGCELVGGCDLGGAAERAGKGKVAGIGEPGATRTFRGQRRLCALGDQAALVRMAETLGIRRSKS
jgi:hypothetical protein